MQDTHHQLFFITLCIKLSGRKKCIFPIEKKQKVSLVSFYCSLKKLKLISKLKVKVKSSKVICPKCEVKTPVSVNNRLLGPLTKCMTT